MSRKIVYRIEVELSAPISDDVNDPDYPTLEVAATSAYKRDIELAITACLRKMDEECTNCEVMDFTVEDE